MQETIVTPQAKKKISFDAFARIAIIATLGLALLVFTMSTAVSFLGTKALVILIGTLVVLACYILARLTRGNVIVPPSILLGAVWLVPLAYALSTLFSGVNPTLAFFGSEFEADTFAFVLTLSAFATLVALTLRRESDYGSFFRIGSYIFGVALVVQVVLILIAKLSPTTIAPLSNLTGSFSDLGMLAGLGVVVAQVAVRFVPMSGLKKIAVWIGMALGLFVLALVNSFLLWVLVGLVALALFIEALMRRQMNSDDSDLDGVATVSSEGENHSDDNRSLGPPLITLVVSIFFLLGGSTIGNAFSSAFGTSFIDVRPSWPSTFEVGSHVLASSPLFGSGPGTFGEQWLKFRDRSINDTIFWNVDFVSGIGYIPTSAITTGSIGIVAWLLFLGLFIATGIRALIFRLPRERFMRFVAIGSFVGTSYVLMLALLAVPGPVVLLVGFTLLGVFISSLRYGKERVEWGIMFSRTPRIGFVVVFALTILLLGTVYSGYVVTVRYLATLSYGQAAVAVNNGDVGAAESAIVRSLSYAPSDQAYRLAAVTGVARMNEVANSTTLSATEAQQQFQVALSSAIQAAAGATTVSPNNYQNWLTLGGVYQSVVPLKIEGAVAAAQAAYERAGQLAPTNPTLPYTLAQLSIATEDYKTAEAHLLEAIALKRDYTQAILLLSQLQVAQGKAKEALQAVEAAIYFSPDDPATLFQAGVLRLGTGDQAGAVAALAHAVEVNTRYANARFFLAVAYAVSGDNDSAIKQLEAVAELAPENTAAVAEDLAALKAGKNPYPAARLKTLGIPSAPVEEPAPTAEEKK